MRVGVTGAHGFVGRALCATLRARSWQVIAATRTQRASTDVVVDTIGPHTDWRPLLGPTHAPVDALIHLAAHVHVLHPKAHDETRYHAVNVEGTLALARQAARAGVRRFVFVSSIKVNGERTMPGCPFRADDAPQPEDAYGRSKWTAEQGLRELAASSAMEVVIVRPPLVYGPGVKGNFATLLRVLERGLPLPLAAVRHNRRSLVSVDNLADLLALCVTHPAAANQTFLVSDNEDLSTVALLTRLAQAMNRKPRLFHVPLWFLRLSTKLIGQPGLYDRLCGSLQVDITPTLQRLGWRPPLSVGEGLRKTAAAPRS